MLGLLIFQMYTFSQNDPTTVLSFLPHLIFLLGPLALTLADLHKVMLGV